MGVRFCRHWRRGEGRDPNWSLELRSQNHAWEGVKESVVNRSFALAAQLVLSQREMFPGLERRRERDKKPQVPAKAAWPCATVNLSFGRKGTLTELNSMPAGNHARLQGVG